MPSKRMKFDSTVQMQLYTLTKRQFVLVFVGFAICVSTTVIIGLAGPSIVTQNKFTASQLQVPPNKFNHGPFTMETGIVTPFNQQVWLLCMIQLQGTPLRGFPVKSDFLMTVKTSGRAKDSSYRTISHLNRNHSRKLTCHSRNCNRLVVMHLGYLNYPSYLVNVNFYNLALPRRLSIRNVVFTFKYYNPEFTQMEIWFRFVFLVLSFTVTCLFAHNMRRFPLREWSIEQKWISFLLPLLLLYNDPLFPMNFLVHSWLPGMLDGVSQTMFFSALLLFWLCAYHGVRQQERKFSSFYLPKLIIVGLVLVIGCALLSWQQYNEIEDPSYNYKTDIGHFMALKVIFFVVGGLYVTYLVILMFQAFQNFRSMPYFDIRLKFLTVLMSIVLITSLVAVGLRFGTAVLQDNFVSEITTNYKNSAEFLLFYGLFNFYLYTMAFVYSPAKTNVEDANYKDKATFRLIYDTDEDIIYGKPPQEQKPIIANDTDEEETF